MTLEEDCPYDTVCFHCQQCAEKYLKALLILHDIHFPKSHDLVALCNLLNTVESVSIPVESVQPLNRYSVEARYPDYWEPILKEEAEEALEIIHKARLYIRSLFPSDILSIGADNYQQED
jgi:HEPN domain-containing protein